MQRTLNLKNYYRETLNCSYNTQRPTSDWSSLHAPPHSAEITSAETVLVFNEVAFCSPSQIWEPTLRCSLIMYPYPEINNNNNINN